MYHDCETIKRRLGDPRAIATAAGKSCEFDRIEMGGGGNMHRLILGLVNGW